MKAFKGLASILPVSILIWIIIILSIHSAQAYDKSFKQLHEMCQHQQSAWCEPAKGHVTALSGRQASSLYRKAWVSYKSDLENFGKEDIWRDYEGQKRKAGDCEDFALTWGAIANKAGVSPKDIKIVYVMTKDGPHMVAEILEWRFDNMVKSGPYKIFNQPFVYKYSMNGNIEFQ